MLNIGGSWMIASYHAWNSSKVSGGGGWFLVPGWVDQNRMAFCIFEWRLGTIRVVQTVEISGKRHQKSFSSFSIRKDHRVNC